MLQLSYSNWHTRHLCPPNAPAAPEYPRTNTKTCAYSCTQVLLWLHTEHIHTAAHKYCCGCTQNIHIQLHTSTVVAAHRAYTYSAEHCTHVHDIAHRTGTLAFNRTRSPLWLQSLSTLDLTCRVYRCNHRCDHCCGCRVYRCNHRRGCRVKRP
jgi:hypothetical protein